MPGIMNGYRDDYGHGPYSDRPGSDYGYERRGYAEDPYATRDEVYTRRLPNARDDDLYARRDMYSAKNGYGRDSGYRENGFARDLPRETRAPPRDDYRDRQDDRLSIPEPVFDMDHLATFTVDHPSAGMNRPEDGIAKLKHLEMTKGIWTMRCQLIIESRDLVIVDKQTGDEMERFPLAHIEEPTAVTNNDRLDVYNNILLFKVREDSRRSSPTEMHIFQCIGKPAQTVVDEINVAIGGGNRFTGRPYIGADARVREQVHDFEKAAERTAAATANYNPGPTLLHQQLRQSMHREDTESILSENTDRDVQLLNCCFDDIEKFVARLQQAAEAYRELDRRRSRRPGRSKRALGDGMLSMRSRPPPPKDFIDVFQKFKFACNLVAKLKPHIHDPNAPELIHFMWTILCLLVDACRDPRNGTPDLASKVVSPLITKEAKDLLLNCLTSKEMELWMSLGDAWTVSRDEWRGYVPPYSPRFSNGWAPGPSVVEELAPSTMERDRRGEEDLVRRMDRGRDYRDEEKIYDRREERARERAASPYRERPESPPPPPRVRSFEDDQKQFLQELRARNSKIYEATHERTGKNQKELTVKKGEILEVIDDARNWWKLINSKGETGHAPYTILQPYSGALDPVRRS